MKNRNPNRLGPGAWILVGLAFFFVTLLILVPMGAIFVEAFSEGWEKFLASFQNANTSFSLWLTIGITFVTLPITAVFGIFAAWALAKFRFPGRALLLAVLDLPFTLSPIITGLLFILLYGKYGLLGPWFESMGLQIIFAWPGVLLTSLFITLPFVVKELLPTMEDLGNEEEEAALTLGAGGWTIFRRVTLPNIRWALLYGLVLAAARAVGEFGAASVVSGLIRGQTATLPIQIEILYNEYETTAAFSAASLFAVFALVTLLFKFILEKRLKRENQP